MMVLVEEEQQDTTKQKSGRRGWPATVYFDWVAGLAPGLCCLCEGGGRLGAG